MPEALATQVGGTHYIDNPIRPTEFAMHNGWDPAAHAILKYVTRHAKKGGLLDLQKAYHNVTMRDVLRQPTWRERAFGVLNGTIVAVLGLVPEPEDDPRISMEVYISMNKIPHPESYVMELLDAWVRCPQKDQRGLPAKLLRSISDLALLHYGEAIE